MVNSELKKLIKKRKQFITQVERFTTFISTINDATSIYEITTRLEKIELLWDEFSEVQFSIEDLNPSEATLPDRDLFEDSFFSCVSKAKEILEQRSTNARQVSSSGCLPYVNNNVKLPTLNLPEFSGLYGDYIAFSESFEALINSNVTLSKVQKFHYLKSCLKGDAAQIIQNIQISEANYDIAWQTIKERYDNKRITINAHIKSIFELPVLQKESSLALRNLLDNCQKDLRCLKSLGQPTESWDSIIIHLISSKLDSVTKREWETSIKQNTLPTFDEFTTFLNSKCQLLETLQPSELQGNKSVSKPKFKSVTLLSANTFSCFICNQNHFIYNCTKFLAMNPQQRLAEIKKLRHCTNCLRGGHMKNDCRSGGCKHCQKRHNSLLHFNTTNQNTQSSTQSDKNQTSSPSDQSSQVNIALDLNQHSGSINNDNSTFNAHCTKDNSFVLLSTAQIFIIDDKGNSIKCRALLDSASQSNFITEQLFQKLNISKQKINLPVVGINQSITDISHKTNAYIQSIYSTFKTNLDFLVIKNISNRIPSYTFSAQNFNIPSDIKLADPLFFKSEPVDILLGAAVFWNLLCVGQIKLGQNQPILQKTTLGWVVSGPMQIPSQHTSCFLVTNDQIHKQMERFWQIEEVPSQTLLTRDERTCEKLFTDTHTFQNNHFQVHLPIRENSILGNSYENAVKRLHSLERKLSKNDSLKTEYSNFLHEYESLGHMTKLASSEIKTNNHLIYYLPHHCVVKEDSSTTKLRVVFDGSAKSSNNQSLNDILLVGPTIQDDLFSILLRFRKHNIVFTADIAKMYRQVYVAPCHRDLQRIIWREDANQPIQHFRLNTVTYGTASASFLAIRSLHQAALNHLNEYPEATRIIMKDFYVDDLITGFDNIHEATQIKNDICKILHNSGFDLRKFKSNNPNLTSDSSTSISQFHFEAENNKILGVAWDSVSDSLQYVIKLNPNLRITKRTILSVISQVFDPLGLVGPFTIRAKILMQELWKLKISWDETVPPDMFVSFNQLYSEFQELSNIQIPRQIVVPHFTQIQVHGFCDSSEAAYGACIYFRTTDAAGNHFTNLVCAKSRVAPLKVLSLPRLELMGALLLAKLCKQVMQAMQIDINEIHMWSDSTIVLAWLDTEPSSLKTFVSNRVATIQHLSDGFFWHHVSSNDNPADIISRGMSVQSLIHSSLWWHGPSWLSENSENWPKFSIESKVDMSEFKTTTINLVTTKTHKNDFPFQNFSSWSRLVHVVGYCLRFAQNCRKQNKLSGFLSLTEIRKSELVIIKMSQSQTFLSEINQLSKGQTLNKNTKILSLSPFLDENAILRVGGRLKNSTLKFEHKHQALISHHHILAKLIVTHEHEKLFHAGPQAVLASIRTRFWLTNGRNITRELIKKCIPCFRQNAQSSAPLMGNLPQSRVQVTRPFENCGVDFAGPIFIKDGTTRTRKIVKNYICLFVCMATKAVHLELVGSLSKDDFINCLKRFVSRRGLCRNIYCDNATNFVGAQNELNKILNSSNKYLSDNKINWHFIPPRAPHFGGLWESGIKSCKQHLIRIVGDKNLTYEQFYTVLTQIEAILNSRPLTPLSSDPNDYNPLTPGHFLVGSSLIAIPEESDETKPINRLKNYQLLKQLITHFWNRWNVEYLSNLQSKTKWKYQNASDLKIGTLVLIREENSPPMKWPMGRIIEVIPGNDGIVRVVKLKTRDGLYTRAFSKICVLPID